jgi:hypothetical protein
MFLLPDVQVQTRERKREIASENIGVFQKRRVSDEGRKERYIHQPAWLKRTRWEISQIHH